MTQSRPEAVVAQLGWRYAVKKFDRARRIDDATWQALEKALVLAPSSFGLQPWRFLVVENAALRTQLRAASWKQAQVEDGSHLVVFAIRTPLGKADVTRWMARLHEVRGTPQAELDGYQKMIEGFIARPGFDVAGWCARQAYIALGPFMTAAALLGVDTCPMEGIDPAAYDRILGLPATGYATVVACVAGYRAADDRFATLPKVRYAHGDMVLRVR
jgi:nitroreductase